MPIDPASIKWDAPDPAAVKWDAAPAVDKQAAALDAYTANKKASLLGPVRGLADIGDTLINGAAHVIPALAPYNDERNAELAKLDKANAGNPAYGQGRTVANIAATYPVGGALAAPVRLAARAVPALAPLAEAIASGGFRTGRTLAPGVGNVAGDLAVRSAGGAAAGGATAALVNPDEAGLGAIIGGLLPGGGKLAGTVGEAAGGVARSAKAAFEPLYEAGRSAIAGRTLNSVAGQDAAAVAERLRGAAPVVPGSMPTAAQVAENGGIAALERSATQANPADFAQRGMEQSSARLQALRGIAGDDAERAFATANRNGTAEQLYGSAFKNDSPLTPSQLKAQADLLKSNRIENLMKAPAIQEAANTAKINAANAGKEIDTSGGSIEGLHHMKLAIDDMLKDPTTAAQSVKMASLRAARTKLIDVIETLSPDYKAARTVYADMSKPINQMQVGQSLIDKLEPALADHGALARETGNKYALALRNADQTAKAATGFKGAGMADVMTPAQMDTINSVAADLARKANAQELGRGVGSNTFQNLAMDNIAQQSGSPRITGALLNLPGVSKFTKFAYSGPEEKIKSLIAQSLLNPQSAAELMSRATTPERTAIEQLFANPKLQGLGYRATAGGVRRVEGGQ